MNPDIVKDSSLWCEPQFIKRILPQGAIHVGIVRKEFNDKKTGNLLYEVEILANGKPQLMICQPSYSNSSPLNYEEYSLLGVKQTEEEGVPISFNNRVGETVVVGEIDYGVGEGIILGCIRHPKLKTSLKENEPSYVREFNGLKTTIDKDGAWKILFQGIPKNLSDIISKHINTSIPEPEYDETNSGSYVTFEKDGSFEVSDGADEVQSIRIDKQKKTIAITSGDVKVLIDKEKKTITTTTENAETIADKKWTLTTEECSVEAKNTLKLKSAKIAIGSGDTELLEWLITLIDKLSDLQFLHPYGPTSPVKASPQWAEILSLQSKLKMIKGSL